MQRLTRLSPWVVLLMLLSVGLAACGDEAGESTTTTAAPTTTAATTTTAGAPGQAAAQARVEELTGPAAFMFTGPAITVGDQLQGKRIYAIGNGLQYFFVRNWLAGVNEAAAELGMTVTAVDASTSDPAGLIDQAVTQGYDIILIQSVDSGTVAAPLTDAMAAGIPAIELTTTDPQLPTADQTARGVFGVVTFSYSGAARDLANVVVADGGAGAAAVIYRVPGLVVSEAMAVAFQDEMSTLCPTCSVSVVDAPFAQWGNLQALTGTAIEANADAAKLYLVPPFDSMVPSGVAAAIAEKGVADTTFIVTYNGTDAGLSAVADGTVLADIGGPQYWLGWATVDQVARALLGQPPVEDEMLPERIFSAANIGGIDLTATEAEWYGGTDFRAEYRTLWGIGG